MPVLNKMTRRPPSRTVRHDREHDRPDVGRDPRIGEGGDGDRDIRGDRPDPGAEGDPDAPLRALIFDSWFDPYHGAVSLVRVVDGTLSKGEKVRPMAVAKDFLVTRVCVLAPRAVEVASLGPGEVGIFSAAIKEVADTKIGDTVTDADQPAVEPLPGFRPVKPMVFAGLYPAGPATTRTSATPSRSSA